MLAVIGALVLAVIVSGPMTCVTVWFAGDLIMDQLDGKPTRQVLAWLGEAVAAAIAIWLQGHLFLPLLVSEGGQICYGFISGLFLVSILTDVANCSKDEGPMVFVWTLPMLIAFSYAPIALTLIIATNK